MRLSEFQLSASQNQQDPHFDDLDLDIEALVKVLKKRWSDLSSCYLTANEMIKNSNELKIAFIHDIAKQLFFYKATISWEKVCIGHQMRFNKEALNAKNADLCLQEYISKFLKDPSVRKDTVTGLKEKIKNRHHKYDVRISFFHHKNTPCCNSPPKEIYNLEPVQALSILSRIDAIFYQNKNEKLFFEFYERLFQEMTFS